MPKPKAVNWKLVECSSSARGQEDHDIYALCEELLSKYHSTITPHIIFMWRYNVKTDQDNFLFLADITKSSDKMRELSPHDFIIGINKSVWEVLDAQQRCALIDAQLERIAPCLDKQGNHREDDYSRLLYRLRRPEVVDESTLSRRHGTTLQKIQEFAINNTRTGGAEVGSYVETTLNG